MTLSRTLPALLAACLGAAAVLPAWADRGGFHSQLQGIAQQAQEPGRVPAPSVHGPGPGLGAHPPGWGDLRVLPPGARYVPWQGQRLAHWNGLWWRPSPRGYVAVRPPPGLWVDDLPLWRSVLVIGGITYFVVNGIYYRAAPVGGYEVVETPPATQALVVVPPGGQGNGTNANVDAPAPPPRQFVYPRQGQNAEQQAADEYACYRWAVTQSGFDPVGSALGTGTANTGSAARPRPGNDAAEPEAGRPLLGSGAGAAQAGTRADHDRARAACLEARGYTVR